MNGSVHICSFSGRAADLKPAQRTPENVLAALKIDPRVSTWDLGELPWLHRCIVQLIRDGKIKNDEKEPYPWHRFILIEKPE